jgi:hypothetical protein
VLATPWTSVENALAARPSWSGRTLVDATNAYKVFDPPNSELFDFGDRTSSEVVASLALGASVVKAFNHVPFMRLLTPLPDGERHVLFLSGTTPRPRPAFARYSKRTTSPSSTSETWPPVRASSKRAAPSAGGICASPSVPAAQARCHLTDGPASSPRRRLASPTLEITAPDRAQASRW